MTAFLSRFARSPGGSPVLGVRLSQDYHVEACHCFALPVRCLLSAVGSARLESVSVLVLLGATLSLVGRRFTYLAMSGFAGVKL